MPRPQAVTVLAGAGVLIAAFAAATLINGSQQPDRASAVSPAVLRTIHADLVRDQTDDLLAQVLPAKPGQRVAAATRAYADVQAALAFSQANGQATFLDRRAEGVVPTGAHYSRTTSQLRSRMSAAYAAPAAANRAVRLSNEMFHSVDDPSYQAVQGGAFHATDWKDVAVTGRTAQVTVVGYFDRSVADASGTVRQVKENLTSYEFSLASEEGRWRIADVDQTDLGKQP